MKKKTRQPGTRGASAPRSHFQAPQAPTPVCGDSVRLVSAALIFPDPAYEHLPLTYFVGRCVKVPFQTEDNPVEHMWVKVTGVDGDRLIGTLDNEAVVTNLRYGDDVHVSLSEVVMVYLSPKEWRDEVDRLRVKGDYFNSWLGAASGRRFDRLYEAGLSPRQALTWWRDWQPWEGNL